MQYILNIAKHAGTYGDGAPRFEHFARVELPNMLEGEAKARALVIRARFPESEGFKCDLSYWEKTGRDVQF